MDNTVEIIIKAVDKASGTINGTGSAISKLGAGFKSLTGFSLSAAGGIAMAGAAVNKMIDFTKQAVNETVAYGTSIKDMSRLLGLGVEETSRLVQASDDLFLSQESLTTAMLAASRKGIDTSISGLKALSEQYLSLAPGVERAKFLMDNFGRSGAQMGKLMEVGAAGIDTAMASIQESLVMTNESIANIENYKRSVDNLQDSWMGFKTTVGMAVIPELDLLMRVMTKGKDATEEHYQAINRLENQYAKLASAAAFGSKSAKAGMVEVQAEIDAMNTAFYGLDPTAASNAFATLSDSIIPVTTMMEKLTTSMIFNAAAAGLDADAQLALADAMGLIMPNTLAAMTSLTEWRDQLATGQITISEYEQRVANLATAMERLKAIGNITSTITVNYAASGGIGAAETMAGRDLNGNGIIGKAGGGPVWGNRPYLVGERGPEMFVPKGSGDIVSNKKLGGNNVTFYGDAYFAVDRELTAQDIMKQMRVES